jgi:hypothetical protein
MTENLLPSQPVRRALSATSRKKAFMERLWRLMEEYLAQIEDVIRENVASSSSFSTLIREISGLVSTLERLINLDKKPQPSTGDNSMNTPKSTPKGRTSRSKTTPSLKGSHIDADSSQARLTQMRDTLLKKLETWAHQEKTGTCVEAHENSQNNALKEPPQPSS